MATIIMINMAKRVKVEQEARRKMENCLAINKENEEW